jgi:hypothetical protein
MLSRSEREYIMGQIYFLHVLGSTALFFLVEPPAVPHPSPVLG